MKSVKKLLFVGFIAVVLGMPLVGADYPLTIGGTVPLILQLTISDTGAANSLTLTDDATDVVIARIVERSNNKSGYTVTLTSANAVAGFGTSFKALGTTDSLAYTLKYGASSLSFTGGVATLSTSSGKTSSSGTASKELKISYTGSSYFLDAATYSDSLTFTIAAN